MNLSYQYYFEKWVENSSWLMQRANSEGKSNEQQRLAKAAATTDMVKFGYDRQQHTRSLEWCGQSYEST